MPVMTELFFAEACDYVSLRNAIRARVEQLNISRVCLDEVGGLPAGYSSRLLAPTAKKKIGQLSLELMLKAAGLKMVLVDDREALAKFEPMYAERDASQARPGNQSRKSKGKRTPKKPYVSRRSAAQA